MSLSRYIISAVVLGVAATATAAAQTTTRPPAQGTTTAPSQGTTVAPAQPSGIKTFEDAVRESQKRSDAARTPPTGEVAVLNLVLDSDGERITGVQINRVQIARANPPKVFQRSRGTWEVRLRGRDEVSYRIPNPLNDIEVENPPDSPSPFSQVKPEGPVPFDLIVPLSRDGQSMGVERIQIYDTETRRMLVDTPVR